MCRFIQCQFYNFSKRSHCLQCNQAKTEHCIMVPSTNASTAADGISDIVRKYTYDNNSQRYACINTSINYLYIH